MKLDFLVPERRLFTGLEVVEATLPTSEGQIQVLPGHAAMMGKLETGPFRLRTASGEEISGALSTGFFEVKLDSVQILAETAELRDEINSARAREAQKKAEQKLAEASLDEGSFKKYQYKLQRAMIRQQVAGKPGN